MNLSTFSNLLYRVNKLFQKITESPQVQRSLNFLSCHRRRSSVILNLLVEKTTVKNRKLGKCENAIVLKTRMIVIYGRTGSNLNKWHNFMRE